MGNIMSPLRLFAFRNEKNNTQTFQFILSEYESDQVSQWESIVSGASAFVQDVSEVETKALMYFVVTENPSSTNLTPILFIDQSPKLYTAARVEDGACVYGGDLVSFDITEELFNLNGLEIFKNGNKLEKTSENISFIETNYVRLGAPLQKGDVITFSRTLA